MFTLLLGQLGKDFDSPAFRVLTTGFTIVVLLQWLYLMARLIPLAITGRLFLEDADDRDRAPAERKPHKLRSREDVSHASSTSQA